MMKKEQNPETQSKIAELILRDLPDWFGIEESTQSYIKGVKNTLFFTYYKGERPAGFVSFIEHYPGSFEVYVMGVLQKFHGKGVGTELMRTGELELKAQGAKFLQVKTVSENRACPFYSKTRKFYLKSGFTPLEEFKTLWGEANPCLLLVKSIL
jgi:ribosomal protein S18 acetylase RimI-like enzyme